MAEMYGGIDISSLLKLAAVQVPDEMNPAGGVSGGTTRVRTILEEGMRKMGIPPHVAIDFSLQARYVRAHFDEEKMNAGIRRHRAEELGKLLVQYLAPDQKSASALLNLDLDRISKAANFPDLLPGGLADNQPASAFDLEQLQKGTEVELEHTHAHPLAQEIAQDHLAEIPDYYTRLQQMEESANQHDCHCGGTCGHC